MTACLDEYALFRLFEGEGSSDERAHKDECDACGRRYQRLTGDVDLLARTVREGPPPLAARRPVLAGYGWWIPALTVVAVELAVVLWTGRPPAPPRSRSTPRIPFRSPRGGPPDAASPRRACRPAE